MNTITAQTTLDHVAAIVCERLRKAGIDAILVGGAVVSIYTENEYQSYDLDFILPGLGKNVDDVMKQLGFEKKKTRYWAHPQNPFFVEFPGTILAIGRASDIELSEIKTPKGTLRLLSPTSSVMDRLAAYFYWNDRQGLDQAVMIAQRHPVDFDKIKKWSYQEGHYKKFDDFLTLAKQ